MYQNQMFTIIFGALVVTGSMDKTLGDKYLKKGELSGWRRGGSVPKTSQDQEYCLDQDCLDAARELANNMDQSVDPCQDFYQFACGGFVNRTQIPDDFTKYDMFIIARDKVTRQVRILLESDLKNNDPKPFGMAKEFYESCMDTTTIKATGLDSIKQILKALGGWPVLEGPNHKIKPDFKWNEMVYKFREFGFSSNFLINLNIVTDRKNSSRRVLDLDEPSTLLEKEYLAKGEQHEDVIAYYEYMVETAVMMGAVPEQASKDMKETLLFEMSLSNITLRREERRNESKLYNPMTIGELSSLDGGMPWLEYINTLLSKDIIQVNSSEVIIVDVPSYFTALSSLLSKTPVRTQANYLMWRAMESTMSGLTEEAAEIQQKLNKKLSGKKQQTPRWRRCVASTSGSFSLAVGSMYVSKYFKEDSKAEVVDIVHHIKAEFLNILDQVEWMDKDTKSTAKKKAAGMVEHIGYPSELKNTNKLQEYYSGLEINKTAYLENNFKIGNFFTNKHYSKLRERVNKTSWIHHGREAVVNAYYFPTQNSIELTAGILQGQFFSKDRPRYLNYAALGWIVGHEITHGFDDKGSQNDGEGNLVDWWKPETKYRYIKKTKCMIDQYSNYTVTQLDNLHLNGINTQGENIADNGGIKTAYRAYNAWVEKNGAEKLLPGLNYNQNQLFWINAANVWCAKYRSEALKKSVLTEVHSPKMFRVQGPFSNQEEFGLDWNCKVGSPMNPKPSEKCKIW